MQTQEKNSVVRYYLENFLKQCNILYPIQGKRIKDLFMILTHHRQEIKLVEVVLLCLQSLTTVQNSQQEFFHFHPQRQELLYHLPVQGNKIHEKSEL